MTDALREAARVALEALEAVAQDAYGRAGLVCCNRPGLDCCGNPAPQWTDQDAALMDATDPVIRALRAALDEPEPVQAEPVAVTLTQEQHADLLTCVEMDPWMPDWRKQALLEAIRARGKR